MQVHLVKVRLNAVYMHECICHYCERADDSLIMRRLMNRSFNRSHQETEDMTFDVLQLLVLWSAQANRRLSPGMRSPRKDKPE